jgi:hypothetical protein
MSIVTSPEPQTKASTRERRWLIIGAVALVLVLVAVLAAVLAAQVIWRQDGPDHVVTAPLGDRHDGTLDLVGGVGAVVIRSADLDGDRFRVSTPDGSGQVPRVEDRDGVTALSLVDAGEGSSGKATLEVLLSARATWRIRISGGADSARLDLRAGPVSEVDLASGISTVEIWLPAPRGTGVIRETGGTSLLALHAPAAAPVSVTVSGGAGSVVVDGVTHSGIGAPTTYAPDGWSTTTDRYDVQAVGGLSQLRLERF